MRPRLTVMLMLGLICSVLLAAPLAWAGAGGAGDPVCLVAKKQIEDPHGVKITGTLAIDVTDVNSGYADVVMRLERHGDVKFIRSLYQTSGFTFPTLLAVQNRLCEILTIDKVIIDIKAAFGLVPSVTHFVFTKRGIRDAEIDVDPFSLVIENPAGTHAITMADIVIFGQ